jgi:hypothetical protein
MMISVSVAECESEPLEPVIVNVTLDDSLLVRTPDAVTVNVDVDDVGFGENDPLRPETKPVADRETGPLKPFVGEIVTVYVEVDVGKIVRDVGLTEIEKFGDGPEATTRVAATECVAEVLVSWPVIVNG